MGMTHSSTRLASMPKQAGPSRHQRACRPVMHTLPIPTTRVLILLLRTSLPLATRDLLRSNEFDGAPLQGSLGCVLFTTLLTGWLDLPRPERTPVVDKGTNNYDWVFWARALGCFPAGGTNYNTKTN